MIRPHILTRIKGRDACAYTRFRAEANAVLVRSNGAIATMLAEPAKIEYAIRQEEVPSVAVAGYQKQIRRSASRNPFGE